MIHHLLKPSRLPPRAAAPISLPPTPSLCRLKLFRFHHETTALLQVDSTTRGRAVRNPLSYLIFKSVAVVAGRIGTSNAEQIAQFGKEKLAVGTLGRAGICPASYERGSGLKRHSNRSMTKRPRLMK